jgi:23S rRNA (pseudouridine1915-N3)-methyltransferase
MRFLVVAVGIRPPRWVQDAFVEYAQRFPRRARLELIEIRPEQRSAARSVSQLLAGEAKRIEAALPASCRRVVCDERGRDITTTALAKLAAGWVAESRDVAFLVGGPDGLDSRLKATAELTLRLSSLTLPHALVRVLVAEQLYRVLTILDNHPYHRV